MESNLDKVNKKSLTKIFFSGTRQDVFEEIDKVTTGLIFAGDGMFYFQNNDFGLIITKTDIPYKNLELKSLNINQSYFKPKIRKPNLEWFQYIIECFKYVNNKTNNELLINLYYSKSKDRFVADLPQAQVVSSASDNYKYSNIEYDPDFIRYAQIHSHNKMDPTPSVTDNKDEQLVLCYQGIVGNLSQKTDVFTVSCSFRCWTGLKDYFVNIEKELVFIYPEIQKNLIDQQTSEMLDAILAYSKKKRFQKVQNNQKNPVQKYNERIKDRQNTIRENLLNDFLDDHFDDDEIESLDESFKRG